MYNTTSIPDTKKVYQTNTGWSVDQWWHEQSYLFFIICSGKQICLNSKNIWDIRQLYKVTGGIIAICVYTARAHGNFKRK